jgi:hypothetical protein
MHLSIQNITPGGAKAASNGSETTLEGCGQEGIAEGMVEIPDWPGQDLKVRPWLARLSTSV